MRNFILAGFLLSLSVAPVKSETLADLTAALKANPADQALREKVIAKAAAMKPRPVVPKEARRPFVKASVFQKEAKTPADYAPAIAAYDEAIALAPWWPEAYYNRSTAQAAAGKYEDAIVSLKLFLASKPDEKDAAEAETTLYKYEAKKEIAAKKEQSLHSYVGRWNCRAANGTGDPWVAEIREIAPGSFGYKVMDRETKYALEGGLLKLRVDYDSTYQIDEISLDATGGLKRRYYVGQDESHRQNMIEFRRKNGYALDGGQYHSSDGFRWNDHSVCVRP